MAILDKAKKAIRITNNVYNEEVQDLINACILDLKLGGVDNSYFPQEEEPNTSYDSMITQAIITYCKANFGFDNNQATLFREAYALLKSYLSIVYADPMPNEEGD